jgi:sugar lactone lactonase YvrE
MRIRALFTVVCSVAVVTAAPAAAAVHTATGPTTPETGMISTYAGTGQTNGPVGDGGQAAAAVIDTPSGVAVDTAGNTYVSEYWSSRVRKITPQGVITTLAGTGVFGSGPDGGPAASTQLETPSGIAVDGQGDVFIADDLDSRVREVTPAGIITTVAGNGSYGFGGDGGPAKAAILSGPTGVAVDLAGNLYISDTNNNRVRKVGTNQVISTVLGTGVAGSGLDQLAHPRGLAVNAGGLYVADTDNNRIEWQLQPANSVLTLSVGSHPRGVALDPAGDLYIADTGTNRVRVITSSQRERPGAGTTAAGFSGDGGQATAAELNAPEAVAVDGQGNVTIADTGNNRVRRAIEGPVLTAAAGNGIYGNSGDGGPAIQAMLGHPTGIAVNQAGDLYISDPDNFRMRKVSHDGIITTFANRAGGALAFGPQGNLYAFGDYNTAIKIDPQGKISQFAGTVGKTGSTGDGGPATQALLGPWVSGIAADGLGNVYILDTGNSKIRKVDANGIITTFAGTGTKGYSGDGGPATAAMISPYGSSGIVADQYGNVYFSDTQNFRIRKVDTSGVISTVVGTGTQYVFDNPPVYNPDGLRATALNLSLPQGMAVDSTGSLYFMDANTVNKVDASGVVRKLAGAGIEKQNVIQSCGPNGGPAKFAEFGGDGSIAVNGNGDVYVSDHDCYRVRQIPHS